MVCMLKKGEVCAEVTTAKAVVVMERDVGRSSGNEHVQKLEVLLVTRF